MFIVLFSVLLLSTSHYPPDSECVNLFYGKDAKRNAFLADATVSDAEYEKKRTAAMQHMRRGPAFLVGAHMFAVDHVTDAFANSLVSRWLHHLPLLSSHELFFAWLFSPGCSRNLLAQLFRLCYLKDADAGEKSNKDENEDDDAAGDPEDHAEDDVGEEAVASQGDSHRPQAIADNDDDDDPAEQGWKGCNKCFTIPSPEAEAEQQATRDAEAKEPRSTWASILTRLIFGNLVSPIVFLAIKIIPR